MNNLELKELKRTNDLLQYQNLLIGSIDSGRPRRGRPTPMWVYVVLAVIVAFFLYCDKTGTVATGLEFMK